MSSCDEERAFVFGRYNTAEKENIFTPLINKYYGAQMDSPEVLDNLFLDLYESKELNDFRDRLTAEAPAYTGVYHYDPFTVHYTPGRGCFAGGVVHGATNAFGRVFHELTPDKVQLWRTDEGVVVLIDHPSYFMRPGQEPMLQAEPTVLFNSTQMGSLGTYRAHDIEEAQVGLAITYGASPIEAQPPVELVASSMLGSYEELTLSEARAGHLQGAEKQSA